MAKIRKIKDNYYARINTGSTEVCVPLRTKILRQASIRKLEVDKVEEIIRE